MKLTNSVRSNLVLACIGLAVFGQGTAPTHAPCSGDQEPTRAASGYIYSTRAVFFPFTAQTFAPITTATILKKYDITSLLSGSKDQLDELLVRTGKSEIHTYFDEHSVRLVWQPYGKSPIYVDNKGNVFDQWGTWKLSDSSWKRLQGIVKAALPD